MWFPAGPDAFAQRPPPFQPLYVPAPVEIVHVPYSIPYPLSVVLVVTSIATPRNASVSVPFFPVRMAVAERDCCDCPSTSCNAPPPLSTIKELPESTGRPFNVIRKWPLKRNPPDE